MGGTSGGGALCDEGGGGEAHDQSQGVTCDVKIGTRRRLSRRTARELGAHRCDSQRIRLQQSQEPPLAGVENRNVGSVENKGCAVC